VLTSFTSSTDLPAPRPVAAALPAPATPRPIEREGEQPGHDHAVSRLGRVALGLEARRWLLAASNILAAALFVVGCVAFYWPTLGAASVTLFLLGSLLFLVSALGSALLDHRPGHRR
jgi:YrhK-like protein